MTPILAFTPQIRAADLSASIGFYAKLGFEVAHSFTPEGRDDPSWVELVSGPARLMVGSANDTATEARGCVSFYVFCEDVAQAREALADKGLEVSEIRNPPFNPRGEFDLTDPDGHTIYVTHT